MILAVVSNNTFAEWIVIGTNDGGDVYADPVTIIKEGNQVKIWALINYKMPRVLGSLKPLMSMKIQTEFDCKDKQSRGLSFIAYAENMGGGKSEDMSGAGISYIDANSKKWISIPPNGTGLVLSKLACGDR